MRRRTFCKGVAAASVAFVSPPAALSVEQPASTACRVFVFNGRELPRADVDALWIVDTRGDLPALWEAKLRQRAVDDLLPMAGMTTAAEFDLLRQALGPRAAETREYARQRIHGRNLVRWRLEAPAPGSGLKNPHDGHGRNPECRCG